MEVETTERKYVSLLCYEFRNNMQRQVLPNDSENAREFDVSTVFELADSNMNFNASPTKVYEPSGATGKSDWNALFTYILDRFRERSTAFVLVDDRDLT